MLPHSSCSLHSRFEPRRPLVARFRFHGSRFRCREPREHGCASCHSLDRVKNKTADNAGWTTTVARMKEKGANLTDEVPVVVEFLTKAAGTLTVAHAGGGRGAAEAAAGTR
jgi:hypothetical protein